MCYTKDGDTTFRQAEWDRSIVPWQIPCGKCLACRLLKAREKAIRSIHTSKMYEENSFITLTYSDDFIRDNKLCYTDFQKFMKRLRKKLNHEEIPFMVTGEYGDINKRMHWHVLLFNWKPRDGVYKYTSDSGHDVFKSEVLDSLWKMGNTEFGSVTLESAGYVARYAAKKLVHGKDGEHDFEPIHKTSKKHVIGKKWIEENYKHTFENGFIVMNDGTKGKIPRYYLDWCKKYQPEMFRYYIIEVRPKIIKDVEIIADKEEQEYLDMVDEYGWPKHTRKKVKDIILHQKFKKIMEFKKL